MKRSFSFSALLACLLIVGCGGGGSDNSILNPGGSSPLGTPQAASIQLIASSPQFQSDQTGLETMTLTAIARDGNNNGLEGVALVFDAGGDPFALIDVQSDQSPAVTGGAGILTAELSNGVGGAENRTIRVTATDVQSGVSASINIQVVGTSLTIEGAGSLAQNDTANYVVVLSDSQGIGIPFQNVTVTSSAGNTIDAPSLVTDGNGKITFSLTATQAGNDTLTVSALGETTNKTVVVSNDQFALTHAPTAGPDIALGTVENITLTWTVGGAPQASQAINFTSTRGTLSSSSATTNASGQAAVTISSNTAGPSVITASNASGTSTTLSLEFVATNPTQISLQASPFTVGPGQSSEIVAVVRDAADNLVKNQVVNFLILADDSNGFLTAASATTNSQGKATTFYTGGQVQGASNGVQIEATVAGTAVSTTVSLTVARLEFDFIIGTGNEIFLPTTATYAQEWNIIVTDSVGNSVQNTPIQVSLRSLEYGKGQLVVDVDASQWNYEPGTIPETPLWCPDEDVNRNGILELAEDANGSGQMEAGNVATVAPVPDNAPPDDPCTTAGAGGTETDVLTNNQGIARVCVIWPQNFAWWVRAQIEALSTVSGSESSQAQSFVLPALSDDINDITSSPPNRFSPFGTELDCALPPPGLPLP